MKRAAIIAVRVVLWPIVFVSAITLVVCTYLGWGSSAAERVFEAL